MIYRGLSLQPYHHPCEVCHGHTFSAQSNGLGNVVISDELGRIPARPLRDQPIANTITRLAGRSFSSLLGPWDAKPHLPFFVHHGRRSPSTDVVELSVITSLHG